MKILHIIPYMHPRAGGPPVVVENVVRETIRAGHDSEILSTPLLCTGDEALHLERLNRISPTSFVSDRKLRLLFDYAAHRTISEKVQASDIVHVHTLWHPINILARRACANLSRPYVLMPHGMLDPYSLGVKSWRKQVYLWTIERKNLAAAQRLVFTSLEEARLAASSGAASSRVVVAPLGGDAPSEDLARLRAEFIATFPQVQGRRQILFLGRLHFKKGLDRLLAAIQMVRSAIPDTLLTIVGDGSPRFVSDLKEMIVAMHLQEYVLLTGALEGATKWGAYASADVFVLASRQENFAIAVAEAMHAGIPVIVSDRVNIWPLVQESRAGIVLSEDNIESSLATAITSILRDPKHSRMLGMRGQVYARNKFTWAETTRTLLRCYEAVLEQYGRSDRRQPPRAKTSKATV